MRVSGGEVGDVEKRGPQIQILISFISLHENKNSSDDYHDHHVLMARRRLCLGGALLNLSKRTKSPTVIGGREDPAGVAGRFSQP